MTILSYADGILPARVRYADISATEKLLFAEISANLDLYGNAFLTDEEIAGALKIRVRRVGKLLDGLEEAGLICVNCDGSYSITHTTPEQ